MRPMGPQNVIPDENTAIYIVALKQAPSAHFVVNEANERHTSVLRKRRSSSKSNTFLKLRNISRSDPHFGSYIARVHDSLLRGQRYLKLYSYHYLINGFAVLVTSDQADKVSRRKEVANVVIDFSVRTDTTHTPEFLGLPKGDGMRKEDTILQEKGLWLDLLILGLILCIQVFLIP